MFEAPRLTTAHWLLAAALAAAPNVGAQDPVDLPVKQTPAEGAIRTSKSLPVTEGAQVPTPLQDAPKSDELKKSGELQKTDDAKKTDDKSGKTEPPKDANASQTKPGSSQTSETGADRSSRSRRDRTERTNTGPTRPPAEQITGGGFGKAEKLQLNIADLEWERLLEILAQRMGRTLNYVGKKPTGVCPAYKTEEEIPVAEVIDVINQILIPKGFILQRKYNFLNVLEYNSNSIPPQYIDTVTLDELAKKAKTEIVRVLFKPNKLIASQLATDFKEFVAPVGSISAIASTNELNITGTADNVRQVIKLIEGNDSPSSNPPNFEALAAKFIPAIEAEIMVRGILGMPTRDAKQTPANPNNPNQGNPFGGGGRNNRMAMMFGMVPQQQPGQPQPGGQPAGPQVDPSKGPFIAIDERSNTLMLFATPDKIAVAGELLKKIDTPAGTGQSTTPFFEVYEVESGTAPGIAQAIGGVFDKASDTRVEPHPDGNHILVYATPREHAKVKEIIAKLRGESKRFEAIQLRETDALDVAKSIRSMLGQKEDDNGNQRMRRFFFFGGGDDDQKKGHGPQVAADSAGNRLLVYGTEPQIQLVKELLIQLGETSLSVGADRATSRVIQMGEGNDARELEARIKDVWGQVGNKTPIRVEILGGGSAPPANDQPPPRREKQPSKRDEPPARDRKTSSVERLDSAVRYASLEDPKPAALPQPPPTNTTGPQRLPTQPQSQGSPPIELPGMKGVTIIVGKGTIMVQSDDPKALDEAEKMVRMLVRGDTNGRLKVYKLKSADASELAYEIDDIINPPRQSGGFGFFGGGNEETDEEKAQRARIVADTHMNALLVIGPPAAQAKVKELINLLDDESPDTDVKSAPRSIEIKYKSASAVAEQLKAQFAPEVFQQQQNNQNQQQGGGGGPGMGFGRFGMFGGGGGMFGGGGGGRRGGGGGGGRGGQGGGQESRGKVVITADDVTNLVWVTAPKPKFDEIELVAQTLDSGAASAKQTVRVMTLKHTNTDTMQKMLHQTMGVETQDSAANNQGGSRQNNNNQMGGGNLGPFNRGGFGPGANGGGGGGNGGGGGGNGGGGGGGRRGNRGGGN